MFNCAHCTDSFLHTFSLVKHLESAHEIAQKKVIQECGRKFRAPILLKTGFNKNNHSEEFLN